MSGHASRKHARLSASGRYRWSKCSPSPRLSDNLPEPPTSDAAALGTRRHEWLDYLARRGVVDAREYIGITGEGSPPHTLDAEGAEAVNVALDKTWELMKGRDCELYVEQSFDYSSIDSDLGGTGDICIVCRAESVLDIVDFKNGWFIVDAKDNSQLLQYAIGAWLRFKDYKIRRIRIHVVQPRDAAEQVKTWEIDAADLWDDKQKLKIEAARTRDPNAPAVPGEHCTFCVAGYHQRCEARRLFVEREAAKGFSIVKGAEPGSIPPEIVRELLASLPAIEKYVATLKDYARDEAKAGRAVAFGKKRVAFQMRRAWNKAGQDLAPIIQKIWPTLDPWKPRDLKSPSDLEKEVGAKTMGALLKDHITKTPFGEQLVDLDDPRTELSNPGTGFVPVTPDK